MKINVFLRNKIFINSMWSFLEKLISIFGLIFVTSLIAKYIGPENFGKLNYTIILFSIVQTITWMGSENIIFQRASKNSNSAWFLIKKTKKIRNIIFNLVSIPLLTYLYIYTDLLTFYFGVSAAITAYIMSHDLYAVYFNAQLKSYINTLCNIVGLIASLIVRFIIVELELNILWLCFPVVIVALIPFSIRFYIFNFKYRQSKKINSNHVKKYGDFILKNGGKLLIYTLAVSIFTKTAQILIGKFVDMKSVGIFIVASTIGGGISIILNAFINSMMVGFFAEKDVNIADKIILKTYKLVLFFGGFFILFLYLMGDYVIEILYGIEYITAVQFLYIFCLAAIFSSISNISEKYIMKQYGYSYLQRKTIFLLLLNLLYTYQLISLYGMWGGVLSVLITEILAATLLNYFFKNGIILKLHLLFFYELFGMRKEISFK